MGRDDYVPTSGYMVVPGVFYWSADSSEIALLPTTSAFYSQVSPIIVTDTDGDGTLEVVICCFF